jgi:hypothetical protein
MAAVQSFPRLFLKKSVQTPSFRAAVEMHYLFSMHKICVKRRKFRENGTTLRKKLTQSQTVTLKDVQNLAESALFHQR